MIVAICDDDKIFRKELKEFLINYKTEHRLHIDILEFDSGYSLLDCKESYDIVFLDYQMPNINGMETAHILRSRKNICSIIFITSFPEFMIEAFEVNTYRFLIKPLDTAKLSKSIDCFIKDKKMHSPIIINENGEQKIINSEDIIYIEGSGKYCIIRTIDTTVRSSKTLSGVLKLLPQHCFYRTHKSYALNLYCIVSIKDEFITLNNGEKSKISRNRMNGFKKAYKDFIKHFNTRI